MKSWVFQDAKQLAKHGAKKCPWSVGWYDSRGKKRQKSIGAKTTAKTYARKLEGEVAAGLVNNVERVRWADFQTRFDSVHLGTKAPRTRVAYLVSLEHFKRVSAPAYVDQVDAALVDEFRSKRFRETKKETTTNRDLRHLRCALNKATRWGLLRHRIPVDMMREPERDSPYIDDEIFGKLYEACDSMTKPAASNHAPAEWWRALLVFGFMTGWRIGEIMSLRRDEIDFNEGIATLTAERTKGRRDVRIELHPVVIDHLKMIAGFDQLAFSWPHPERAIWDEFRKLKVAAEVEFPGAFHRLRFGFANANVDHVPEDVLQHLMRHKCRTTTRHYVHQAQRMRRQGTADRLHVPAAIANRA